MTAGFAVKMAIVPLHSWLPDAYTEAPAPMSALLAGVLTSAGAYAVIRISLGVVLPALVANSAAFATDFLYGLSILGVISAFFGSFLALRETDIKKVMAYSSISHMGYIMFGFSLFFTVSNGAPVSMAINGTVLQVITHGLSKGLFFLTAGAISSQLATRNMREMGGLAGKMPRTATSSITAALSLAGTPPFACFISEVLIFIGAFQVIMATGGLGSFYIIPTALMLVATVLSLGYSLRFISNVFFGPPKTEVKTFNVPKFMQVGMIVLAVFVILVGIYPTMFLNLIGTVHFI